MEILPSLVVGLAIALAAVAQPSLARETKTAPGPAVDELKHGNATKPKPKPDQKKADKKPTSKKIKIRPLKKLKDMTDK